MEKKRFIFDLDGTLLTADFSFEKDFFYDIYGKDYTRIINSLPKLLDEYEKTFPYYDKELLSDFLTKKIGLLFDYNIINEWIRLVAFMPDTLEEGAVDLLEYLKNKGYSLVVLTNWFGETQIPRLQKINLFDYFDEIYTGEYALKSNEEAYDLARGEYDFRECVMIGDNFEKDYLGPIACSMNAVLYDKEENVKKDLIKVKRLSEIKNIY